MVQVKVNWNKLINTTSKNKEWTHEEGKIIPCRETYGLLSVGNRNWNRPVSQELVVGRFSPGHFKMGAQKRLVPPWDSKRSIHTIITDDYPSDNWDMDTAKLFMFLLKVHGSKSYILEIWLFLRWVYFHKSLFFLFFSKILRENPSLS